ncbi:hypothetical protein RRG08_001845 [Elysia crispata]|uniref:Uncharacterized protein n=2 Tax=Elysia crispata TaxID=231223 RepID=A0AAE1DGJ5_9GAST|nr:hypothetical protein RRG08_001845 [Elysia crispata]
MNPGGTIHQQTPSTRSVFIILDSVINFHLINNVVVLYVISAPIWLIFSDQENTTFELVSLAIVLCSFLSMGLIIIPEEIL